MYSKFKIKNAVAIENLTDLLRKAKACLLKIIMSPDYQKAIIS
jgi:hypothetical protein